MEFSVWAPGHRLVELVLEDGRRLPMRRAERGWWHLSGAETTTYRYAVDGGDPHPDPRSAWQPQGIEGPSGVVDHKGFAWQSVGRLGAKWPPHAIYELHIGTFSSEGTFEGAVKHLDHLVHLGVDAVEVMPVAEASGERGWGYDGVDLWAPHHAYGGPAGLKYFVEQCHVRGLAVIVDVVYNHLGPVGNYLGQFGPYFTDAYKTPWGSAVNMDGAGSYGVREFVIGNALMWLRDYHIDGLRLDAVHAIYDESAVHILEQLASAVDLLSTDLGRPLWLIAENDRNDPRVARARGEHGYGLSACWDDDFHHALHALLTGESHSYYADFGRVAQLAKAFTDGFVYDGSFSEFRQRDQGRSATGLPGSAFVCFLQNHDQVGNRARGERMSQLVGTDLLKVGAALLLLSPFVPMVFQGEEWGASTPFLYFTDHKAPELARAVSDGRRREHPTEGGDEVPDPQDLETFLRSKLDWSEADREPHRSLLEWHRRLIALRRQEPDLAGHNHRLVGTAFDEERRWLVVRRGRCFIAANLADQGQALPLEGATTKSEVLLSSGEDASFEGGRVKLGPRAVAVVAG